METGFHTQTQPRVRETRMHSHVTHVIRSRLAILPARIASCCRVGMDQLAGLGSLGSISRMPGPGRAGELWVGLKCILRYTKCVVDVMV
jgi:hypothetical protein